MTPAWAQRQEALVRAGVVSPAVFTPLVERLRDCVRPYPDALATEAGQCKGSLSLAGRLAYFPRQQAEDIAPLGEVERQVLPDCSGTALWAHRPLVPGLVRAGVERWGKPDGSMAWDPSRGPQRGTPAGGVQRQGGGHRGQGDTGLGGVCMGAVSRWEQAFLACRWSLPGAWARAPQRRAACHVPEEGQ
jgi:hypothetical protein